MPLRPLRTKQFERDIKRCQKRGKNMEKLKTLIVLLLEEQPLPIHYRDHPHLVGTGRIGVMPILSRIGCCSTVMMGP